VFLTPVRIGQYELQLREAEGESDEYMVYLKRLDISGMKTSKWS